MVDLIKVFAGGVFMKTQLSIYRKYGAAVLFLEWQSVLYS